MKIWGLNVRVEDTPLTRRLGWYIAPPEDEALTEAQRRVLSGGGTRDCPLCREAADELGISLEEYADGLR